MAELCTCPVLPFPHGNAAHPKPKRKYTPPAHKRPQRIPTPGGRAFARALELAHMGDPVPGGLGVMLGLHRAGMHTGTEFEVEHCPWCWEAAGKPKAKPRPETSQGPVDMSLPF